MAVSLKVINNYVFIEWLHPFSKTTSKLRFLMIKTKICSYTFILQLIKVDPFATKTVECSKDNIFLKNLKKCNQYHWNWKCRQYLQFFTEQYVSISYFFMSPIILSFFFFFFFLFFSHTTMLVRLNSSTMDQTWALAGGWWECRVLSTGCQGIPNTHCS